jgi:hypothetical protein
VKRGTIAATAAAALALVGAPALVGTANAAPNEAATAAGKVAKGRWNSYVVVMKADPLLKDFAPEELDSAKAKAKEKTLKASHGKALKKAGLSTRDQTNEYTNSLNGFSVLADHAEAEKLAADPAVAMVVPDELRQKQSVKGAAGSDDISYAKGDTLRQFLGIDPKGSSQKAGKKADKTSSGLGDGELLGVIDSGIWPEHPSFADDGSYPDAPELGGDYCEFGNTAANPEDAAFECNDKLVGARQMLNTYRALVGPDEGGFDSARDDDGHGTHTASTAAGNANVRAWIYDESRTVDYTSGIAPRAQIIAYKALGALGGFTSDLADAIDQAVEDGVDVINYSIGGGPGVDSADAISFLFANDAGVHVATSAGNSGPGASTIGGPADLPWVTTVGASTQPRFYGGTVQLGNGTKVLGSSVTLGSEKKLPLVDAKDIGNEFCLGEDALGDADAFAEFQAGAEGKMVLCWRGQSGRSEKSRHVLEAGGKAMILSNVTDVDNYFTDNFRVPTVMVDKSEGDVISAYSRTSGATATIKDTADIDTFEPAPSMAIFSSRGPNPSAGSVIKPDITAPGVQVLAGASPVTIEEDYEPGQLFQAIAGTSMSSPVMAGMFLLADEAHPDWSPAAAKSAVMTTAYQDVVDNDRTTQADPFDFGAGHVSAPKAFNNPGLVYDSGFYDYVSFLCNVDSPAVSSGFCASLAGAGYPTTVEDLNYPTIGISQLAGSKTVHRTVTNVSGKDATFTASVENPEGMTITVSPSTLTLADGESGEFEVTVKNDTVPFNTDWAFGAVVWKGAGVTVRSNVAAYATPFEAPGTVSGEGASGSVEFPVQVGFNGTYVPEPAGLAGNEPLAGTVDQDPDQTFGGCTADQPGVSAEPFTVEDGTSYLRLELAIPGDDDIDLFLCTGGKQVASSTSGGTDELIEMLAPAPGEYVLYVHGWAVPHAPLDYSVGRWQAVRGEGGLTVDPTSVEVSNGDVVDVTASWTDAPEGVSYGVVEHTTDGISYGSTVVQVTNLAAATG